MSIQPFDFQSRTRFVFGGGSINRLGELAAEFRPACVLVVSDRGIVDAGHDAVAKESLRDAGLRVESFHDFAENPTSSMVDDGVRKAAEVKPDLLVGLGGGSSMDCCKGINFVYSCGGSIHDYHGVGKATCDLLPMIAIPTTSGTGSESQSFALISDAQTHVKMPCGDPRAACRIAILDPQLTLTQPQQVTALTGIDALSHAIETHVTLRRNAMSTIYSRRAFGLLAISFSRVLSTPDDFNARSEMQLGACLAGMAIENSMLGAAHATANPLTARYNITHGQAVGLMLPAVVRMNGKILAEQGNGQWYSDLVNELDQNSTQSRIHSSEAFEHLAAMIETWLGQADLATSLDQLHVPDSAIESLAQEAMTQWTGTFNPVPLNVDRCRWLYQTVAKD